MNPVNKDEILKIDREISILFEKRMNLSRLQAEYNKTHGLPIEAGLGSDGSMLVENREIEGFCRRLMTEIETLSTEYQRRIIKGVRVAYSGVEGAFASIAAHRIFPECEAVPFADFREAYRAVENADCDCAVLPIENSFAGDVGQVMDLAEGGSLYISGVWELSVVHNLLGLPAARIEDVKRVISHPQALTQCGDYIKKMGFSAIQSTNTAAAAKLVSDGSDPTVAAIASAETAELYGLKILEKSVNDAAGNTTRFAVFTREKADPTPLDDHFIMFFTVKHEAGSLSRVLAVLAENGLNLHALKSRPTKKIGWEYYFYVEGEGDVQSAAGFAALEKLRNECKNLKLAGVFSAPKAL